MALTNNASVASFVPEFSTNSVWVGDDVNLCLTDKLTSMETSIGGKADSAHTHSGYAEANHTHNGYATADHSHEGYAEATHTHSEYASNSHNHSASEITGLPTPVDAYTKTEVDNKLTAKAESNHTHTEYASSTHTHNYAASDHTHNNYATTDHTHSDYATSNHTHSNNVIVEQTASPYVRVKLADSNLESRFYKNASATADYGTTIADYTSDGKKDSLIFCRNAGLANRLYLNVQNDDDSRSIYYLYGEHHKPTASEIGAMDVAGGDITGNLNVNGGVIKAKNAQAIYNNGSRITFGSGSLETYAIGTTLYCNQAWSVASDERLKENVAEVDVDKCAEFIKNMDVKTFNYIGNEAPCIGVIAQDVEASELGEYFVSKGADGYLAVKASDLVFPLIATVQKLQKEIEELKNK